MPNHQSAEIEVFCRTDICPYLILNCYANDNLQISRTNKNNTPVTNQFLDLFLKEIDNK